MILTLYTEGYFSAAHRLTDYDGKCSQLHGHTWKVAVWVKGDSQFIQANGILWDFNNIKQIIKLLDHADLNTVIAENPTAEHITLFIYRALKKEHSKLDFLVRLFENPIQPLSYCETGDFVHV